MNRACLQRFVGQHDRHLVATPPPAIRDLPSRQASPPGKTRSTGRIRLIEADLTPHERSRLAQLLTGLPLN
jgi:hypothetical protein